VSLSGSRAAGAGSEGAALPDSLLIIYVDADGDIEAKLGISSPLVGRERCLRAAIDLALADPEEADANALFAAIRELDEVSRMGIAAEIAVISGFPASLERSAALMANIRELAEGVGAKGLIFVSDGAADERILPVLQSIKPVYYVRRVVVRQSESLEVSYSILGRYLRLLLNDPRYSKYSLGLPGLLLVVYGIVALLGYAREALIFAALFLGAFLIYRGLGLSALPGFIRRLTHLPPLRYFWIVASTAAAVLILTGIVQGAREAFGLLGSSPKGLEALLEQMPRAIGLFLEAALGWLALGAAMLFLARIFQRLLMRRLSIRSLIGLAALSTVYVPLREFSLLLQDPTRPPFSVLIWTLLFLTLFFVTIGLLQPRIAVREGSPRG
jgi:putative membrane protein